MAAGTTKAHISVHSTTFANKGNIPQHYGCDGEGVNPGLQIDGIPPATESVALIMDDPDAPGGLFTHWLVWNIPPGEDIAENSNPGISGTNSAGKTGYHPPCPPNGRYRYYFRVFALNTPLNLPAGSNRNTLEAAMQNHIIARAELMGYYEKA